MCVEIIRACGLLAAVNEAAIWLGGGKLRNRAIVCSCCAFPISEHPHSGLQLGQAVCCARGKLLCLPNLKQLHLGLQVGQAAYCPCSLFTPDLGTHDISLHPVLITA